ncbi:MAG: polysaccharide biosynthesis/export protein [Acidobacteriaceae bacterium]|jgi:polysaccharide export outer membrane protein|nr:polysaccharide biosynthesis/export protein [Acidobacteriaceae bacterium]MEA2258870.1 polysaccharide biosynthesis/export protein [Acidobacteriaceae bacterium]
MTMVSEFMRKSPAKLILLSLCFQGLTLVPALAQGVVPADGRVGVPIDSALPSTTADAAAAAPSAAPTNVISYVLGPEDQITVRVFAANDIPDKPVQIDNDGSVTLPMIGSVHAAGLTVEQLEDNLVIAYKKYFKDPQVTVQVNDFRSQPVSVAGNVTKPGVVQLRGNRNLMEVIGQAGGLRADAGDSVLITRNLSEGPIPLAGAFTDPTGKYSVAHINIRSIMSGKDPEANIQIKPHDVITVPRARLVYVLGDVSRPGGYVMTENETMSLTQAIALAGGWSKTAALSSARVLRANGGATREQLLANVKKIMENKAPDLQLQPDDILYIPNSLGKVIGARGAEAAIGLGTGVLVWRR